MSKVPRWREGAAIVHDKSEKRSSVQIFLYACVERADWKAFWFYLPTEPLRDPRKTVGRFSIEGSAIRRRRCTHATGYRTSAEIVLIGVACFQQFSSVLFAATAHDARGNNSNSGQAREDEVIIVYCDPWNRTGSAFVPLIAVRRAEINCCGNVFVREVQSIEGDLFSEWTLPVYDEKLTIMLSSQLKFT